MTQTRSRTMPRARNIPFLPQFIPMIRSGRKTCTARYQAYGRAGEVVSSKAGPLVLDSVTRVTLDEVADLWRQEGCRSREHFIETWNVIHPGRQFQKKQRVYLHRFHTLASDGQPTDAG